ncbi:MAG: hypothetical protein LBJ67_07820 [Planctomycetaceae bacterium]|jgi:hypothetical protein|nr:hypothetical protein [Planctomycetaceae bacterium]
MRNFRQVLALVLLSFFLHQMFLCYLSADSNVKYIDVVPEKATEKYDTGKYAIAIKKFRELAKEREQIETKAKKDDPAYARAREWYENEKAGVIGHYKHQEKEFLKNLSEDQRTKYNQWKIILTSIISPDIMEKELHDHSTSNGVIAYFFENAGKARVGKEIQPNVAQESNNINLHQLLNDTKKMTADHYANINIQEIENDLNIPVSLKEGIISDTKESILHNMYTFYIYVHTPKELKSLDRELITIRNELTMIRFGWEYAEGLLPDRNKSLHQVPSKRNCKRVQKGLERGFWLRKSLLVIRPEIFDKST